jgi:hypothetical protein
MSEDSAGKQSLTLNIGDGGTTFEIEEHYGPCLTITSRHLGNNEHTHKMMLTKSALTKLAKFLTEAAELAKDYTTSYVYPLSPPRPPPVQVDTVR